MNSSTPKDVKRASNCQSLQATAQLPVRSNTSTPLVLHAALLPALCPALCPAAKSLRTPLPSPVKSSASASSSVAARQVPGRDSRSMIALLLFLGACAGLAVGAEVEAGCGLLVCRGGGGGGRVACGGGGAMGEEERVIVSLSAWGFVGGCLARVSDSGLAVGGGVVGSGCCAGWMRRMKPPSVSEGRELGSGLGDGRAAGEVVSAGGVGSEC